MSWSQSFLLWIYGSIEVDGYNYSTWNNYGLDLLMDDSLTVNAGVDTSIATGNEMEIKGGYIHLIANTSGDGNIYVTDKIAGNKIKLADYPINWKAIKGVTIADEYVGSYVLLPTSGSSMTNTVGFRCTYGSQTYYWYIDPSTGAIKKGTNLNFSAYHNVSGDQ